MSEEEEKEIENQESTEEETSSDESSSEDSASESDSSEPAPAAKKEEPEEVPKVPLSEKLLNLYAKVENAINKVLWVLWSPFGKALNSLIDSFLNISAIKWIRQKKQNLISTIQNRIQLLKTKLISLFKKVKDKILFLKSIDYKGKYVQPNIEKAKKIKDEASKEKVWQEIERSREYSKEVLKKTKKRIPRFSKTTVSILGILMGLSYYAGKEAYESIVHIAQGSFDFSTERAPASIPTDFTKLPAGYQLEQRKAIMDHIRVPVYRGDKANAIRDFAIDYTIVFKSATHRDFFKRHEFLFQDALNMNLEPVLAGFPLEKEGDKILKSKIIGELDQVFVKRGMNSGIKDIAIHYKIAN